MQGSRGWAVALLPLARRRREYEEDERRHGRNPTSLPPMPAETERLVDALAAMEGAASEVQGVIDLEAMITLPEVVAPLPPKRVRRQIRRVRSALEAITLALHVTDPLARMEPSDEVRMDQADGDGDVTGSVAVVGRSIAERAASWLDEREPERLGPLTVQTLEAAAAYLRGATTESGIDADELQQVAEAYAEFRAELDRAREVVLRAA
jgi:hypothetical protein